MKNWEYIFKGEVSKEKVKLENAKLIRTFLYAQIYINHSQNI